MGGASVTQYQHPYMHALDVSVGVIYTWTGAPLADTQEHHSTKKTSRQQNHLHLLPNQKTQLKQNTQTRPFAQDVKRKKKEKKNPQPMKKYIPNADMKPLDMTS